MRMLATSGPSGLIKNRATRRAASPYMKSFLGWMLPMARARGAAARPYRAATEQFPTSRVDPATLEKFRRAREARNCSFSLMTEELLARAIYDETGHLVGLHSAASSADPVQEELPLKSA